MLEHLGEQEKANKLKEAIKEVLLEKKYLTKDLGGSASTTEYTDQIIAHLK